MSTAFRRGQIRIQTAAPLSVGPSVDPSYCSAHQTYEGERGDYPAISGDRRGDEGALKHERLITREHAAISSITQYDVRNEDRRGLLDLHRGDPAPDG